MTILDKLCVHDTRNPNHIPPEDEEDRVPPRDGCACDNCFYGRDSLALTILELRILVAEAADYIELDSEHPPLLKRLLKALEVGP